MAKKIIVGDLVKTIYYTRYGLILEIVQEGENKYLPDCHALVAFIDGLTYWKLCHDLEVISKS